MEDAFHGCLDGIVVEIDRFWVVCSALWPEWLSGGEQGFDGFVAENEEGSHRPETGQERLLAAGVGGPAGDVLCGAVVFDTNNSVASGTVWGFVCCVRRH